MLISFKLILKQSPHLSNFVNEESLNWIKFNKNIQKENMNNEYSYEMKQQKDVINNAEWQKWMKMNILRMKEVYFK